MEEAYMLKIDNDDYELDPSNHRGFYYQLFCRRANGYLSIDPSYNKEATVIKLEICPNRGEHIDKFLVFTVETQYSEYQIERLGYRSDNKTEYYVAAKFNSKQEPLNWPNAFNKSPFDETICGRKISLYLVKSDNYSLTEGYVPLRVKAFDKEAYFYVENFDQQRIEAMCIVSIFKKDEMSFELVDITIVKPESNKSSSESSSSESSSESSSSESAAESTSSKSPVTSNNGVPYEANHYSYIQRIRSQSEDYYPPGGGSVPK